MSSLAEIEIAAAALSLEEQRELLARLSSQVKGRETPPLTQPRIAGLHRGMVWMAADFDDPLPDEFWLSEEDLGCKTTSQPAL